MHFGEFCIDIYMYERFLSTHMYAITGHPCSSHSTTGSIGTSVLGHRFVHSDQRWPNARARTTHSLHGDRVGRTHPFDSLTQTPSTSSDFFQMLQWYSTLSYIHNNSKRRCPNTTSLLTTTRYRQAPTSKPIKPASVLNPRQQRHPTTLRCYYKQ